SPPYGTPAGSTALTSSAGAAIRRATYDRDGAARPTGAALVLRSSGHPSFAGVLRAEDQPRRHREEQDRPQKVPVGEERTAGISAASLAVDEEVVPEESVHDDRNREDEIGRAVARDRLGPHGEHDVAHQRERADGAEQLVEQADTVARQHGPVP